MILLQGSRHTGACAVPRSAWPEPLLDVRGVGFRVLLGFWGFRVQG